jgi:hypothetical protein
VWKNSWDGQASEKILAVKFKSIGERSKRIKSLSTLAIAEVAQRVDLGLRRVNYKNEAEKKKK